MASDQKPVHLAKAVAQILNVFFPTPEPPVCPPLVEAAGGPSMSQRNFHIQILVTVAALLIVLITAISRSAPVGAQSTKRNPAVENAAQKVQQGEQGSWTGVS